MAAAAVIGIVVFLVLAHLAGGARAHHRHYREHGAHPDLYYTYGRGWWGSVNVLGFRVGHRVSLAGLVTAVLIPVVIAVAVVSGFRAWQAHERPAPPPVPTVFTPSPAPPQGR
jgi:hypothetical protein